MTNYKLVFLLLKIGACSSCGKQEELPFRRDAEGAVTSMPYAWKTSLSEDGNLISGFIHAEVTYQGDVLFAAQREGKEGNALVMLSGSSGELLWEFDDFFEVQKSFFSIRSLYHRDRHLVFQDGRQFYHLDLATGNIFQKEEKNYEVTRLRGMEELYLVSNKFKLADDGLFEGSIIAGNIINL